MNEQQYLEACIKGYQMQAGIAAAVALGVMHWRYELGSPVLIDHVDEIMRHMRGQHQIAVSDPDKVLSMGAGIQIGHTDRRWISRGDYAQAVVLLGAQVVDVMRQIRT